MQFIDQGWGWGLYAGRDGRYLYTSPDRTTDVRVPAELLEDPQYETQLRAFIAETVETFGLIWPFDDDTPPGDAPPADDVP